MNQTSDRPAVTCGEFPPYGFMDDQYMAGLKASTLFPTDWRGDAESWNEWFEATLRLITDLLWPEFDRDSLQWRGESVRTMRALTIADLDLLSKIRREQPLQLDQHVTTKVGAIGGLTHREIFKIEDFSPWGTYYSTTYDTTLPLDFAQNFASMIVRSEPAKVADTDIRFKSRLQRPRPYQMSMALAKGPFSYLEALSALTPSMICGHCLEALMDVGAMMEEIIMRGRTLPPDSQAALEQYAVDIGDRRVMASVHYPSDALSSWLVGMRMANQVFRTRQVKSHLWNAISQRSFVYKLIVESRERVYHPALEELAAEAER